MGTVTVTNLGKAYKQYPTRWSRLAEWLIPFGKPRHSLKWVLQDINFSIRPGEAVGIIGINGAGKSTLLKMITGTTQPTTGGVNITGRVAAMLELGMGFHPDFTGRQNAFMAGQLLGYNVEEITLLMPEIESFAEIGEYIDHPVRVYSSGMQVRLAFAVSTAVRPDVLIVDEALSVGDVHFQQKCMARIRNFRQQGTTILLVTHDIGALSAICDRAIVLSTGSVIQDGPVGEGLEAYFASIARGKGNGHEKFTCHFESPNKYIEDLSIESPNGIKDLIFEGEQITLRLRMRDLEHFTDPHIGFRIQDRYGLIVFETNTYCQGISPRLQLVSLKSFELIVHLKGNLGRGDYTLAVGIENDGIPGGGFQSVILPTQVVHKFSVAQDPANSLLWAGFTNLSPRFAVREIT
ncbi:lipopolysaccharide transport system ATP-binding protein [Pseudomonas peli]|uniref:Lipopolysaccharide transport system ATP-binding protein n=1 Tax=Pseudomonas peli TaxID=592361 RepID=A0AB37Z2Y6_9PSED|nr:ABC transporter ATP-binding protein [Pseudomonas peli]NMZ69242.1 ABC transporter ATP-binding protein [Pseudomonas peli]SCW33204.1 lipopolysaccharide transport system ATP-binding protein [Pseudomonas peli]